MLLYRQVKSYDLLRKTSKLVFVMRDNQNWLHFCYNACFFIRFLYTRFTITYTLHEVRMELRHIVKFFFVSDFR